MVRVGRLLVTVFPQFKTQLLAIERMLKILTEIFGFADESTLDLPGTKQALATDITASSRQFCRRKLCEFAPCEAERLESRWRSTIQALHQTARRACGRAFHVKTLP